MDILQRINEIIKCSGLSVRAFSIKCNLSQPTLDKQVKGIRGISVDTIMGILFAFPEVSAEWLLRGTGTMLIQKEDNSAEIARINNLIDTIGTLQQALNAKADTIAALNERIKQLENQIKK